MWSSLLGVIALGVVALVLGQWVGRGVNRRRAALQLDQCRANFSQRREWLEVKFQEVANARGTPRGLEWLDVDFDDGVAFAKDRRTTELTALVAISIQFRAIEGGGMEHVEAVAHRKAATAVFRYRDQQWTTEGRAIFNLNPAEALEYYQQELEPIR